MRSMSRYKTGIKTGIKRMSQSQYRASKQIKKSETLNVRYKKLAQ